MSPRAVSLPKNKFVLDALETVKRVGDRALIVIQVSPHVHSELLLPPPIGHLGVYASQEPFQSVYKVAVGKIDDRPTIPGDRVIFEKYGDVVMDGIVTAVEGTGSTSRPDMEPFRDWHKLHWVPCAVEPIRNATQKLSVKTCCEGAKIRRDKAAQHLGKYIRSYTCLKCKKTWKTVETYLGAR